MKRLSYETQHYIIKLTESYSDIIELMVSTVTLVRKKETLLENRASFEGGEKKSQVVGLLKPQVSWDEWRPAEAVK